MPSTPCPYMSHLTTPWTPPYLPPHILRGQESVSHSLFSSLPTSSAPLPPIPLDLALLVIPSVSHFKSFLHCGFCLWNLQTRSKPSSVLQPSTSTQHHHHPFRLLHLHLSFFNLLEEISADVICTSLALTTLFLKSHSKFIVYIAHNLNQ